MAWNRGLGQHAEAARNERMLITLKKRDSDQALREINPR